MSKADRLRELAEQHLARTLQVPGLVAFFDGCCEPENPGGTAGYGAVVMETRPHGAPSLTTLWQHSGMIPAAPTTSNNIAEYLAVLSIFDWLIGECRMAHKVAVFGDSRLVVCQLWGWPTGSAKWKIHGVDVKKDQRPGLYAEKAVEAREKLKRLPYVRGFWIPRDKNDRADVLSKAELKKAGVEFRIQPEDDR
jgi:ribonuclease HI